MTESIMSEQTTELMLLLYGDGVDREELKALVGSAFQDGIKYTVGQLGERNEQGDV